jgi:CBS domain-containing protein
LVIKIDREQKMPSISSVMTTEVMTVKKDTPIIEAIKHLAQFNITGLPVVNKKGEIEGIVSEKDLLKLTYNLANKSCDSKSAPKTVGEVMTTEVKVFDINDSLADVCECLMKCNFRRVPIVSDGRMVGIVSRKDLIVLNAVAVR